MSEEGKGGTEFTDLLLYEEVSSLDILDCVIILCMYIGESPSASASPSIRHLDGRRSVARSVGMDNGQRIGIEREGIGGRGRGRVTERWTSFLLGGRFSVRPFLEAIPGRRERERKRTR